MEPQNTFCPYLGLQPYTEEYQEFFFGRERDQRIISSNLIASKLTILYGESGVGKSSVLMAGVVPSLRKRARTAVVVFREWQKTTFLEALKTDCLEASERGKKKSGVIDKALPLDDFLFEVQQQSGLKILLVLDQFEEFFFYHPESSSTSEFDTQFACLVNRDDIDVGIMISLREDALAKLDRFRARIPNLLGNTVRLQHLDRIGAEQAIRNPLEVYNTRYGNEGNSITIEDTLVQSIVKQVVLRNGQVDSIDKSREKDQASGDEKVETPLLQMVLMRLWEEECTADSSILRLQTFNTLGGAKNIVQNHLDKVLEKFTISEKTHISKMFRLLVTPSGAKNAQASSVLIQVGDLSDEKALSIITKLAGSEARILRTIVPPPDKPGENLYEIFHDVLGKAILNWNTKFTQEQRSKEAAKRERAVAEEESRRRRNNAKILWASLATCLAAVAALGWWSAVEKNKFSISRELAAKTNEKIKGDPELSIWAALSAIGISHTPEAERALRDFLVNSKLQGEIFINTKTKITAIALSPNGEYLVTASDVGTVKLWDLDSGKELLELERFKGAEVTQLAFSPDGMLIATVVSEGTSSSVELFEAYTGEEFRSFRVSNNLATGVAFSRDGSLISTVSSDESINVWDVYSGTVISKNWDSRDRSTFSTFRIAFSIDGTRMATVDKRTGRVNQWDVVTGERLTTYENQGQDQRVHTLVHGSDRLLAVGIQNQEVSAWDVTTGTQWFSFSIDKAFDDASDHVVLSVDQGILVTTNFDAERDKSLIKKWEVKGTDLGDLVNFKQPIENLTFASDGEKLHTFHAAQSVRSVRLGRRSMSTPPVARSWNLKIGEELKRESSRLPPKRKYKGNDKELSHTHLAISPDWRYVATETSFLGSESSDKSEKWILVWDIAERRTNKQNEDFWKSKKVPDNLTILNVVFSTSTTGEQPPRVAIAYRDKDQSIIVKLWQKTNSKKDEDKAEEVWDIDLTSNICLKDTKDKTNSSCLGAFKIPENRNGEGRLHKDEVFLEFSNDGKHLYAARKGNSELRFADLEKLKSSPPTQSYEPEIQPTDPIASLALSYPKNSYLAVGTEDGTAIVWTVTSKDSPLGWDKPIRLRGENLRGRKKNEISRLVFGSDNQGVPPLAMYGTDKKVTVWDMKNHAVRAMFQEKDIASLAFSSQGDRLAVAGHQGKIRLHNLNLGDLVVNARERLARPLTSYECKTYLHSDDFGLFDSIVDWSRTNLFDPLASWGKPNGTGLEGKMPVSRGRDCPKRIQAIEHFLQGKLTAISGQEEDDAVSHLQKAKNLDSALEIEPKVDAKVYAVKGLIAKGVFQARSGNRTSAEKTIQRARMLEKALSENQTEMTSQSDFQIPSASVLDEYIGERLLKRGRLMASQGKWEDAEKVFQRAKEVDKALFLNPTELAKQYTVKAVFRLGRRIARAGDLEGAITQFEQVKELDPDLKIDTQELANSYRAETLLARGRRLAQEFGKSKSWKCTSPDIGKLEKPKRAVALFREAQALDSELWLDPEKEAQRMVAVAKAESFKARGEKNLLLYKKYKTRYRASEDDLTDMYYNNAMTCFSLSEVLRDSMAADTSTDKELEKKIVALRNAGRKLFNEVKANGHGQSKTKDEKLCQTDRDLYGALQQFRRARQLEDKITSDKNIDVEHLDPWQEMRQYAARYLKDEGNKCIKEGKKRQDSISMMKKAQYINTSISLYEDAQKRDGSKIGAYAWNNLCWNGAMLLFGKDGAKDTYLDSGKEIEKKLLTACEQAVRRNRYYGGYRDSRGVVRVLTGDLKGAKKDFNYYVKWAPGRRSPKKIERRKEWVNLIEEGRPPSYDTLVGNLPRKK